MLHGPDAGAVLRAFAARTGRQPSLVELFRELAVEPSGTPADATSPAPPSGAMLAGAPAEQPVDEHLTAEAQMREMMLMSGGENPLLALLYPLLLGHSRRMPPPGNPLLGGPSSFQPGPQIG